MTLIDTHCHLYLNEFADDLQQVLKRATEAGLSKIILPAIDSSTHEKMFAVAAEHEICLSMIGLHPCSVNQNFRKELEMVENFLAGKKAVAIGEIGLDFYWDKTFKEEQYEAFRAQIRLAMDRDLPVVIHSRNAIDECLAVGEEFPGLKGVFHCFSGNEEQARRIMAMGMMLGIGGVVTYKNSGLGQVVQQVGLSQVVLETDAPYLAPVPYRGNRNEPAYVKLVAEKLSEILALPVEEVAKITTENANRLFSLS